MPTNMYICHAKELQTSGCSSVASGLGCSPVEVETLPFIDNLFEPRSEACFPSPSTGGLGVVTVFGLPNIPRINVMLHRNCLQKPSALKNCDYIKQCK
jgi:hypothetical protein